MKKSSSYRRHRNPPAHEEPQKEKPFFSKESDSEKSKAFFKGSDNSVQAKLSIGQPGDKYEKEADSVADSVVNKTSKSTT